MLGLGLPNRRLESGELARIAMLGCSDYVVYVSWLGDLDYWVAVADELLALQPGAKLHIRMERRGVLDVSTDAALLVGLARAFGRRAATLRIRNEADQESPGLSYILWAGYLVELGRAMPPEVRERVAVPAIGAPLDARYPSWIEASAAGAKAGEFRIMDVHAYGSPSEIASTLATVRRHWQGRLIVTETNPGAGRVFTGQEWAASLPAVMQAARTHGAEAVCLFLWYWQTPDTTLPSHLNVRDYPEVCQVLSDLARREREETVNEVNLGGVTVYDVRHLFPEVQNRHYERRPLSAVKRLVVHHSVTRQPHSILDALAVLRSIQDWHTGTTPGGHDWPAIGYQLALDGEGRVYWLHGLEVASYHARQANADGVGLVILGTFTAGIVPAPHLLRQVESVWVGLEAHLGHSLELYGHREVQTDPTSCPGEWWAGTKPTLRRPSKVNWQEVVFYANWALQRVAAREDPRDGTAFGRHVQAVGKDPQRLWEYGWPVPG